MSMCSQKLLAKTQINSVRYRFLAMLRTIRCVLAKMRLGEKDRLSILEEVSCYYRRDR